MHANLPKTQQGFTLIELMIAITLGLLISAAALMIFLSSQRSLAMQGGMSEIQQNTTFGLTVLTHDLRHANLDTTTAYISSTQAGSGIIFEPTQAMGGIAINGEQVTRVTAQNGSMTTPSDQLTIQYRARTDMLNCEGANVARDNVIVQRYYIDALPGGGGRFALFCDAADNSGGGAILGAGAVPIIPDAESFKMSLAVRNLNRTPVNRVDDTVRYQTLTEYLAAPAGTTAIAVEVGVVMRSSNNVHADANINRNTFNIAGQDVVLAAADNRHLRVPLTQVVAIRNSQGVE